jgi:membrane protease YdiL (CAAX protease family)
VRIKADWSWWSAIGMFLVSAMAGILVSGMFLNAMPKSWPRDMLASIVMDLVILGVLVVWLRAAHPAWHAAIGFPGKGHWFNEIWAGIFRGAVLRLAVNFAVAPLVYVLLKNVSHKAVNAPQQIASKQTTLGWVVTGIFVIAVAPIVEEFFFRGIFFRALRDRYGSFLLAAISSGLLFGAIHWQGGPWQDDLLLMGTMVVVGFFLALIYDRRGNIPASMAAHATFNAIGFILILKAG